jgi:hypothetical protein
MSDVEKKLLENADKAEALMRAAARAASMASREILAAMNREFSGASDSFLMLIRPHWIKLSFYSKLHAVLDNRLKQWEEQAKGNPPMNFAMVRAKVILEFIGVVEVQEATGQAKNHGLGVGLAWALVRWRPGQGPAPERS